MPAGKAGREKPVSKVGNDRKEEETGGIAVSIARVVIAFRNEIAHNGAGDSAQKVHQQRNGSGVIAGEDDPCDVIQRHRQNGDQLDAVGIKCVPCRDHRRASRSAFVICIIPQPAAGCN